MDLKYNFKLLLICHTHNRQKPPNRIQNRNPCKGLKYDAKGKEWTDTKIYDPGKRQNLQCRHRVQGCKDTQGIWQHPWYWQDCILDKNRRVRKRKARANERNGKLAFAFYSDNADERCLRQREL